MTCQNRVDHPGGFAVPVGQEYFTIWMAPDPYTDLIFSGGILVGHISSTTERYVTENRVKEIC